MINALRNIWPYMKIFHGRARHPQSQGSTERANADVKKILASWMRDNKSAKWATGLKFVQLKKNHCYHYANKIAHTKLLLASIPRWHNNQLMFQLSIGQN